MSNKTDKKMSCYIKHHLDITQIYARYRINSNESLKDSTCIPDSTNTAYIIRTTKDIRRRYLIGFAFNNC